MIAFDTSKTVEYWLEGASYDLETAKSLMAAKRFPHALFMGHLTIEKTLKAFYVKQTKKHTPYIHSLTILAEKSKIDIPKEILLALTQINEYNIEGHYPEEQNSFYKKADESFTGQRFKEIEEVYEWFLKKL